MNYSLSLSGQSYTLSTSDDAQIAAIAACRAKFNEALPQTVKDGEADVPNPALLATDAAYLQFVFTAWAGANPGFTNEDLQAAAANAFASYAGQNPPEQAIEQAELTGDALKAALRAYAAAKRYALETGGITLNGMSIATDRETQAILSSTVQAFQLGLVSGPIDWKAASGWAALDQATVTAVATAVFAHVQRVFSRERAVASAIDAGDITTTVEIDAYNWS